MFWCMDGLLWRCKVCGMCLQWRIGRSSALRSNRGDLWSFLLRRRAVLVGWFLGYCLLVRWLVTCCEALHPDRIRTYAHDRVCEKFDEQACGVWRGDDGGEMRLGRQHCWHSEGLDRTALRGARLLPGCKPTIRMNLSGLLGPITSMYALCYGVNSKREGTLELLNHVASIRLCECTSAHGGEAG